MALLRVLFPVLIVATSVLVAWIRLSTARAGGTALVIIDVQNCFTSGGALAVSGGDDVIPVVNGLRSEYARYFDAVVLSQDWHCSDHVSFASQHNGHQPYDRITLTYLQSTGQPRSTLLAVVSPRAYILLAFIIFIFLFFPRCEISELRRTIGATFWHIMGSVFDFIGPKFRGPSPQNLGAKGFASRGISTSLNFSPNRTCGAGRTYVGPQISSWLYFKGLYRAR